MSEENKPDYGPVPYSGVHIIEEDFGRFVRYCNPAEFGIVVKLSKQRDVQKVAAVVPAASEGMRAPIRKRKSYPQIIELDFGRFVRICDPAEFGIVVDDKKPTAPRTCRGAKIDLKNPKL